MSDLRILRSGSWRDNYPSYFRCAFRYGHDTTNWSYSVGFRLAKREKVFYRVLRGGSWSRGNSSRFLCTYRDGLDPLGQSRHNGFRIAKRRKV